MSQEYKGLDLYEPLSESPKQRNSSRGTGEPKDATFHMRTCAEKRLTIFDVWNCDGTLCNVGGQNNLWSIKHNRWTFSLCLGHCPTVRKRSSS